MKGLYAYNRKWIVPAILLIGACVSVEAFLVWGWNVKSLLAMAICLCLTCLMRTNMRLADCANPLDTNSRLYKHNNLSKLAEVYRATTEALASAIAAKDCYAQHHVRRVQAICEMVALELGLDKNAIDGLRVAALVHDVGNLGVPEYILLKPGPLEAEEFGKMRSHAVVGAKVLEKVSYPWDITKIVRHHHERFDGTGYPDHLEGEQIPLESRIIHVAEVYDALVSDRAYRSGWTHREAIEHIEKLAGTHFDPLIVNAFLKMESQLEELNEAHKSKVTHLCADELPGETFAAADVIAQANKELVSLFEIAQTLSSTLEIDEVLALLAHRTKRLSQASTCAVFLIDESAPHILTARAAVGRYQDSIKGSYARTGKAITGKVVSQARPYIGHYETNDLTFNTDEKPVIDFKSCLVVPIESFGEVLGTINLYDVSVQAFSRDDIRTLKYVASHAALAIQNASAFEKIRDTAMRDPLTGLHNGRFLHSCLEYEISRANRRDESLSILGIDLDNFKAVNDFYGHQMGDTVLKSVAEIFLGELRDYDTVVRNGGDEFVIVLPGTPACEAIRTAERIQSKVHQYAQATVGDCSKPLDMSVGVASYPDDAGDPETLLSRADAAMYMDKRARKQGKLAA